MTDRDTKILEALTHSQRVDVTTLAEMLEVSQVTVRKDLDLLENRGLIRREHGYARLDDADDIGKRMAFHYGIKKRLSQAAAALVEEGETVMIGSGSCCALLAEELANTKRDTTIITNSAFVANHIRYAPYSKVILLGGYYQNETQVMVGPMTRKCAEVFFSDKFFIGADGFTPNFGFTGKDHQRAQTMQEMAKQARQVIVLTESEKFHNQGAVGMIRSEDVNFVYTDENIPQNIETLLEEKDVRLCKIPANMSEN